MYDLDAYNKLNVGMDALSRTINQQMMWSGSGQLRTYALQMVGKALNDVEQVILPKITFGLLNNNKFKLEPYRTKQILANWAVDVAGALAMTTA